MKEKIIKILNENSTWSENDWRDVIHKEDFEDVADEIIKLIKSEIYTDTDYLAESMFKHFK